MKLTAARFLTRLLGLLRQDRVHSGLADVLSYAFQPVVVVLVFVSAAPLPLVVPIWP